VTRYPSYDHRRRPIRKDRVALAAVVVVAIIFLPILIRSGCTRRAGPLTVIEDDGSVSVAAAPGEEEAVEPSIGDGVGEDIVILAEEGILTHVVEDGETITDVADALGVTVANVLASNRLYGAEPLQPGQVLYASRDGVLHLIKAGQRLTDIARSYAVPVETITAANGITSSTTIYAGSRLLIPGVTSTFWDHVVELSNGTSSPFVWPLEGEVVSTFGWRVHPVLGNRHHHDGIDIDVPEGTTVYAAASGKVYFYGEQEGYGNVLILEHGGGFLTVYGHLSGALVYEGQFVEAGQEVAQSGNTGISAGPHLHFEIRNGEFPVDPLRYLP
jgi:murein DD-endopeptidase MepM/ murein hydrolase activator NlpD